MGGDEKSLNESGREEERSYTGNIIKLFYDRLLELGYLYKDLYDMTMSELVSTLESRRKGLAYEMYSISKLCHSPFVKNFPTGVKEAFPELFPVEKGIPMPDFLIEKAIKRGVI